MRAFPDSVLSAIVLERMRLVYRLVCFTHFTLNALADSATMYTDANNVVNYYTSTASLLKTESERSSQPFSLELYYIYYLSGIK